MNKIGALIVLRSNTDIMASMLRLKEIGCECCQLSVWENSLYTEEMAERILTASRQTGIEVSTLWAGWSGPKRWNFTEGPSTLGIVPEAYRYKRMEELIEAADFAKAIGVTRVATHAGFLPENMSDPKYTDVLVALRYLATVFRNKGLCFLFETGQETPVTLLRFIEEIGTDNVGINMDTANLILYGKGNSADAITVFGKYVMDTHIKDGFYPTCGRELGEEVKVGCGLANLPEVIKRLRAVNYQGNFVIEREIEGDEQTRDIADTVKYLKALL